MTKKTPQNYTKQKEKEKQGNKQTNKKPPRTNKWFTTVANYIFYILAINN